MGSPIVIADGDIEKREARTENLFKELGDKFVVLDCKEIENLIPDKHLKNYLTLKHSSDFQDLDKILFEDYYKKDIGLGKYLASKKSKDSTKKFAEESGTIKNKINFCNDIIKIMENDNDWKLADHINNLCKKIADHIVSVKK